jgi:CubicO group peptidase (beta-lactamase class C family)
VTREIKGDTVRFREALELLERGAVEEAYQAAVLLMARGEEILFHGSAGEARLSSIFDIASVTKPLVASLFYLLVQQGTLSPDGKISEILPIRSREENVGDSGRTRPDRRHRPVPAPCCPAGNGQHVRRPGFPPRGTGDRGRGVHDA